MLEIVNSLLILPGGKTLITNVDMSGIGVTTWTFNSPVVVTGGNSPQFEIDDGGGFVPASFTTQVTDRTVSIGFPTGAPGISWRVLTPPANMTFVRPFTTPVSGS